MNYVLLASDCGHWIKHCKYTNGLPPVAYPSTQDANAEAEHRWSGLQLKLCNYIYVFLLMYTTIMDSVIRIKIHKVRHTCYDKTVTI